MSLAIPQVTDALQGTGNKRQGMEKVCLKIVFRVTVQQVNFAY